MLTKALKDRVGIVVKAKQCTLNFIFFLGYIQYNSPLYMFHGSETWK